MSYEEDMKRVWDIRAKADEFYQKAKAEGMKTPSSITQRGGKINIVFADKKTQAAWRDFCKENSITLDDDLKY